MTYKIKYTYDTGDSFSNQNDLIGYLELEFNDLSVAEANIQRIKEHYEQYKDTESYSSTDQELFLKNRDKDWFVYKERLVAFDPNDTIKSNHKYFAIDKKDIKNCKSKGYETLYIIDESSAKNEIKLYADTGAAWQIWAPWCGHFETLCSAEIEIMTTRYTNK